MTSRQIQYALAAVFFVLGGWCLLSPGSVLALAIRPEYQSGAPIVAGADGRLRRAGADRRAVCRLLDLHQGHLLAYAVALLPFFVFDYWFYAVEPMLTWIGLLDAVGNVIMLGLCFLGWRALAPARGGGREGAWMSFAAPPCSGSTAVS